MSPKRPKVKVEHRKSSGEREPKSTPRSQGNDRKLVFSLQYADRAHNDGWAWPATAAGDAWEILDFMCETSKLTWGEIMSQMTGPNHRRRPKHSSYNFGSVGTVAQRRLAELRLDEIFEEFFRFRLTGEKRLWGFRTEDVFHLLWWDPEHQVYPTDRS